LGFEDYLDALSRAVDSEILQRANLIKNNAGIPVKAD
jgi:hypothetical protein